MWSPVCKTQRALMLAPKHGVAWILASALVLAGSTSNADPTPSAPVSTSPKRQRPDYDGRGNTDVKAGSAVLWIPRIVLSPLYLTNEFILRRPLGALVTTVERKRLVNDAVELFKFGEGGKSLIVPTALFDFGLLPSVGVYYATEDKFATNNSLRVHLATWGKDWVSATAVDRYKWNHGKSKLAARVVFTRRLDLLFFGIGPDVTTETRSRYGIESLDGGVSYTQSLGGASSLMVSAGARKVAFRKGNCCGDPSLDTLVAQGTLPTPDGYDETYTSLYQRAEVSIDTREPRPATGSGIYLLLLGETDFDVTHDRSWLTWGGIAGGAIDLNGRQRTVKLQVGTEFVDPTRGDQVPFTELSTLGGTLMPGFVPGWMRGRSTFAAQVGYTWPVWVYVDGQVRFSIGNAFGPHLEGLATKKLRASGDIGIASTGKRDHGFEVLFGVGTETFEQGGGITSYRLTFGSRRGL